VLLSAFGHAEDEEKTPEICQVGDQQDAEHHLKIELDEEDAQGKEMLKVGERKLTAVERGRHLPRKWRGAS